MGRKLTVTLAIALLMFVFAPKMASADEITTPDGLLVIPDGSQVTALLVFPGFNPQVHTYGVDFQFPGGTGDAFGNFDDGDFGGITFTVPVMNLSLTAIIGTPTFELIDDGGVVLQCSFFNPCPGIAADGTIDLALSGPISDLRFFSSGGGFGGIESLSFTVDAGDPPTSSLIFLGVGLIGLLVSSRRKVPVCP